MFMGFTLHFYIIFGTNLLTEGPTRTVVFFAYFSVSKKRNIKRSPNGMKHSGPIFLEQMQTRRLGVDVKQQARRPRGCPARPLGLGAPPPSWAPRASIDLLLPPIYTHVPRKHPGAPQKNYFHRHNLLYPRDPILEPSPVLCRRGNRPWRASTSSPRPLR